MNAVHIPRPDTADLPPLVFIHGASGNLLDQIGAFLLPLEGRAEMLFVDRPGHGYSERGGPENAFPSGQADAIAKLMEKRGIEKAIIVGHSFGGAIAASFGVHHPEKDRRSPLPCPGDASVAGRHRLVLSYRDRAVDRLAL